MIIRYIVFWSPRVTLATKSRFMNFIFSRLSLTSLVGALVVLVLSQGCSSTKTEMTTIQIEVSSVGPYFAGPNSFTNDFKVDLASLINEKELSSESIESIKLVSASIPFDLNEQLDIDQYSSASLSVVGSNSPMTSIGTINPMKSTPDGFIAMNVSEEADLAPYFQEGEFTFLLDLDFNEDDYSDEMSVTLLLALNVEYK